MAITDATRRQLHDALIDSLGEEEAGTLMEHLPPVGWADVATKTDLQHLRELTKADLDAHRAETTAALEVHQAETTAALEVHQAETTAALEVHRAETKAEIGACRAEIAALGADLRREMAEQFTKSHRWTLAVGAVMTSILGALIRFG